MRRSVVILLLLAVSAALAADVPTPTYQADVKPASDEALRAMARFRVPAGLAVELWAAEPLLANPVAFALDEKGRCYVAETFRHSQGVPDIRGHMSWLDDDLASRTVADRLAKYRKHLGGAFDTYAKHHDRVKLVYDSTGSGKADRATVFAEGFNTHVTGIGAGLLARGGTVWYTCIPDLWQLKDTRGTGVAAVRESLSTGYGVHTGFIGHDLHGLRFGPDGKLYFSIGDRGANVATPAGTIFNADSGAVFRCNPDGTDLELFATGLRNPQELAFNEFGDLFTCDNNSDGGDRARWVHIVEGGDSGWRIGYQFITDPVARGPWNAEKLWHPAPDNTGASSLPPLFNFADGPSGLTYDPGTGVPDDFRGRFFLCDFRGTSGTSGVRAVKLRPKGASYELADAKEYFGAVLATDCDFGPDGNLYVSDWTEGWNLPGKGRIYRVVNPAFRGTALRKEVQTLLAEGTAKRPIPELVKLLEHADQRVRQEAQFALAAKGKIAVDPLATVAKESMNRLARIHAIWGLGQVGADRSTRDVIQPHINSLLQDHDAEIRAQAARVVGWNRWLMFSQLARLFTDSEPRVRSQAAIAFGRMTPGVGISAGSSMFHSSIPAAIRTMLMENADRDPYLRHAAITALSSPYVWGLNSERFSIDESPHVRLAAVLAMRAMKSAQVSRFLDDADARLVLEAARAIHDVPIPEAEPQLAALITRPKLSDPLGRRVLVANYRQGTAENAVAVVKFATRTDVSEALRVEALTLLGSWSRPSGRDRITGLWRPLDPRPAAIAADAVRSVLPELLRGPDVVRVQAAALCGKLGLSDAGPALEDLFANRTLVPQARAEALKSIASLRPAGWVGTVERAATDPVPEVRLAALEVAGRLSSESALSILEKAAEHGAIRERQAAIVSLGTTRNPNADSVVLKLLDAVSSGKLPIEAHLDVLTAASKRRSPQVRAALARFEASRSKTDHLAEWRESMAGGDAERGKSVFFDKAEVSCQRCHKIGADGGEVGPNLSDAGKRVTREYLLESIVLPGKQIAKGFETTVLTLTNGKTVAGVVKEENATTVTIVTADNQKLTYPKSEIDGRDTGPSAMPADVMKFLSKSELRDLVEYLAGQKADVK